MASRFDTLNMPVDHFGQPRSKLSDTVIGHTPLETSRGATLAIENTTGRPGRVSSSSTAMRPLSDATQVATSFLSHARKSMRAPVDNTRLSGHKRLRDVEDMDKFEKLEIKKAIRREQCRNNQARYRDRQRVIQQRMQHEVQQLHEELQGLKLKRQRLHFEEKTNRSSWSIVSDVFRLLETGLRSPWLMADTDEMMKHSEMRQILTDLQRSFEHDRPHMHLQRVEEQVPGVVTATARLKLTVLDFTIRCVFPHLEKPNSIDEDVKDIYRSLRKKLLGMRLDCRAEMTFLMNEESGRVSRLEVGIDVAESLLQLLRDITDASNVLNNALITQGCVVGDLTDHPQFGSFVVKK
ncbi:hypothetical protein GN244_ATG18402 [Phytophthora infestans]|uniref:Bzip transcription factor n=1 Tax=Phytophthora infestans TaxID=4787 RepID=A0A833SP12_PHYIN|nr:hypothetical protein GN244_ATG18402 [Phytophthora infestans]